MAGQRMKMKCRISSFNCAIDLEDDDDFLAITDCENLNSNHYKDIPDDLEQKLTKLPGISQIEFNGHFGPSIFFTMDVEESDSGDALAVAQIVKDHVKECKKFLKKYKLGTKNAKRQD
jgi:hypothetical protein